MSKKQFVWIMTDTTRYDMLGCYGNSAMRTPNLDALAAQGVRYEYAYSAQPVCGPARSLLFTGLFPHENGSWGNCMPLGADVKTLGQRLSSHGVRCAYIGKWHLDGGDYFGNGVSSVHHGASCARSSRANVPCSCAPRRRKSSVSAGLCRSSRFSHGSTSRHSTRTRCGRSRVPPAVQPVSASA